MDEDDAYDEWRENCSSQLHEALRDVVVRFVGDKRNYYRDAPRRTWEHIRSIAEVEVRYAGEGR